MYTGHKLTLINLQCRYKRITQFVQLPTYNGKPVLHPSKIDELFSHYFGFTPQRGETISLG